MPAAQRGYAEVLADVLGVGQVPVEGNFFDELGADSMVMTRFCARLRKRPDLPNVTIKDIYRYPTINALAAAFGSALPAAPASSGTPVPPVAKDPAPAMAPVRSVDPPSATVAVAPAPVGPAAVVSPAPSVPAAPGPVGTLRYLLCGALQLLFLLGYPTLIGYAMARGYEWVLAAPDPVGIYRRSALVVGAAFLGTGLLPILAKWLLVGRWKPEQFRVWSLRYFRFWLVKTLIRTNPMVRFAGTPLYVCYLRLLGAKIGKGVTVLSPTVPVCTDLLTIGAGSIIGKASTFTGYRAHRGVIQTGPVGIGRDAFVGEATVLDVGSSLGDGAELGHTSSLPAGQAVPAGQRWHGSPAEPTAVSYRQVSTAGGTTLWRLGYSLIQLLLLVGVVGPVGLSGLILLVRLVPQLGALLGEGPPAFLGGTFYRDALLLSTVLFVVSLLLGLAAMITVPRALGLLVRPDTVYRLYGISYWAHRAVGRITNSRFFLQMFGDSSYVVGYLQAIGYDLGRVVQTGSNFGMAVAHDNPFLSTVGSGTVVADGLVFLNADYSSTSFRVSRVSIGAHNFLGNNIFYPAQGRTGDDCLLGTKVMVPIDGPIREGVGLLGSPSFEIPRMTERDRRLALGPDERRRGLAAKNRHNMVSIALLLLAQWIFISLLTVVALIGLDLYSELGAAAIGLISAEILLLTFGYFVLLDRTVRSLQALQPQGCSIYDRAFWGHERYWKVGTHTYFQVLLQTLNGTSFKSMVWRLLGVRVGRRLFDDGCNMSERSFVTIGDDCTLNAGSIIQCHSQENDAFKSDRVEVGSGVTVGVNGFIHYGVRLGDGAVLEADSFLMKGEQVPPYTRWAGNPAMHIKALDSPARHAAVVARG
jgi:non-ribosomal peptide synthetase-like protein